MKMGSDKSFASNRSSSGTADGLLYVSTLNSGTGPKAEFLS